MVNENLVPFVYKNAASPTVIFVCILKDYNFNLFNYTLSETEKNKQLLQILSLVKHHKGNLEIKKTRKGEKKLIQANWSIFFISHTHGLVNH